ncbi:T9SS type A sorting domain-containing protein [Coprobacter secundus]|uniref:Secretion system C-terminal sorting domain-containing protein n=1 Tax=Coprobacter secundus subsp. similis TaxID=2751153 RepID=A0A7G1HVK7_9BACT|nr:T9SS type A sorting domain-containing protein [Coprobacter secundus]BCI63795.1 hypothetical protein Cop2CBH44_21480 [Coprobacter secundus subsp. similis]
MKKMTRNLFSTTLFVVMLGSSSNVFSQESFVIDGDDELKTFKATYAERHMTVQDFTLKNISKDVATSEIHNINGCVSTIKGTVTWENVGYTTTENFFNNINCEGSIIIRNCPEVNNPNGFQDYTTINGDFIIENCPSMRTGHGGWQDAAIHNLTKITGDFKLINIGGVSGTGLRNLKEVGGDFEISGLAQEFWDLRGMPLESIGGSLTLTNNALFENLVGFENLTSIGGDVTIFDNPKLPNNSGTWDNSSTFFGYDLVAKLIATNVIKTTASFKLGTTDNPATMGESYVIDSQEKMDAFIAVQPGIKEIIKDLTISGNITSLDKVQNRVSAITGTVTWENNELVENTEHFFDKIACKGGIILKNCPNLQWPNGFDNDTYTIVNGDFVIENCPKFITAAGNGWGGHSFSHLEKVGGNLRLIGIEGNMSEATLPNLIEVGGDFELTGCTTFWQIYSHDNQNGTMLDRIGGSLIIKDNPKFWSLEGLNKLQEIGGDVIITGNDIPENSEDWRPGLCLVKNWKQHGIVKTTATIELKRGDNVLDVDNLPDCGDGWITAQEMEKADTDIVIYQTADKAIHISAPWNNYTVTIYDISGSLIKQFVSTENVTICDGSNLKSGAYAVRINHNGLSIGRLIVVK